MSEHAVKNWPRLTVDASRPADLFAVRLPKTTDVDDRAMDAMLAHAISNGYMLGKIIERTDFGDGQVGFVGEFVRPSTDAETAAGGAGCTEQPTRSWQSALRQLADTLAPGANVEIDPMDPEVSCARIAEVVQRQRGAVCAEIESIGCNCRDLYYAFWGELPDHEITKHEPACPVAIAALVASPLEVQHG